MNKIARCIFLNTAASASIAGYKSYEYLVPDYLEVKVDDIVVVSARDTINHGLCQVRSIIPFTEGEYDGDAYQYIVDVVNTARFDAEIAKRKAARRITKRLKQLRTEYADMIEIEKLAAVMPEAQKLLEELKSFTNAAPHSVNNTATDNADAKEEPKG